MTAATTSTISTGPFDDPLAVADSDHSDAGRAADESAWSTGASGSRRLHRIAEVRQQQGVTLRNVARRLGIPLPLVRRQEQADCDLRLSELLRWQEVLEVPIAELLVEGDGQLSGPVLERSRMVKLMKTAAAIRERSQDPSISRMVTMLVEQILEIMPELADVTPWHTVGQRRTRDDLGRTARMVVPEDIFRDRFEATRSRADSLAAPGQLGCPESRPCSARGGRLPIPPAQADLSVPAGPAVMVRRVIPETIRVFASSASSRITLILFLVVAPTARLILGR